jgi:type II secretory pathway component GspD/PulD (secretin)
MVSKDVKRNIFLDKDIKDYKMDLFIPEKLKQGEIYELYKNVLFEHDLKLQFNKRGKFYFVSKLPVNEMVMPQPHPSQKLHYYSYKIKNITNEDVLAVMKIFPKVKYSYLKQSDIIAYSATLSDHAQVKQLLKKADNKVRSKTIRITIFTVNKSKAIGYGSKIRDLSYNFGYKIDNFLTSLVSSGNRSHMIGDTASFSFMLYAMEEYGIANIQQSPTLLITNGKPTMVNSVLNLPYKTSTVTTDDSKTITRDQVSYRDIGLIVKVDPKIKGDSVFLNLELISEELLNKNDNKPITQKITYQNYVTVKKGKPVLLTGIKKVSKSLERGGVPILSDLPILGQLFKDRTKKSSELNINIMIELVDNSTKHYTKADFASKLVSKPKAKVKRAGHRSKALDFLNGRI